MIDGKTFTCFIPAKRTSTRLPGKNVMACNGEPLISYPVKLADKIRFDHVVVSTEDYSTIMYVAVNLCVTMKGRASEIVWHQRPEELCTETSSVWDAVKDYIQQNPDKETDYIILLHPTSPCLRATTVKECISSMLDDSLSDPFTSLMTVSDASPYTFNLGDSPDFSMSVGTQCEPYAVHLNNAINIISWKDAEEGVSIFKTNPMYAPIASDEAVDIDNMMDLQIAEAILQWRKRHE